MTTELSSEAMHARFPPGALLPLVDSALRLRGGTCTLRASCAGGLCRAELGLPTSPGDAVLTRVRNLLVDIDGAAGLTAERSASAALVTLWVTHEAA
jgi:hypothetical protein